MRNRSNIFDRHEIETVVGEGPNRCFATTPDPFYEHLEVLNTVFLDLFGHISDHLSRSIRSGLLGTLEGQVSRARPTEDATIHISDSHDGVVVGALDTGSAPQNLTLQFLSLFDSHFFGLGSDALHDFRCYGLFSCFHFFGHNFS